MSRSSGICLKDCQAKIDVLWDIELSSIPILFRVFVKEHMSKDNEQAVRRIAEAAGAVK